MCFISNLGAAKVEVKMVENGLLEVTAEHNGKRAIKRVRPPRGSLFWKYQDDCNCHVKIESPGNLLVLFAGWAGAVVVTAEMQAEAGMLYAKTLQDRAPVHSVAVTEMLAGRTYAPPRPASTEEPANDEPETRENVGARVLAG